MPACMSNQQAIWSYFQQKQISSFDGAYWRLERLVHYAARKHRFPAILNIGIGNGYLELLAHQRRWAVTSVDPDEDAVNRLRAQNIDARRGVIEQLPLDSESVDVVFASEVFEHLNPNSLRAGVQEIARVLRPDGHVFGTVPYKENLAENECICPKCKHIFHRWGHEQTFTAARMRAVLELSLNVDICEPRYFPSWKTMDLRSRINAVLRISILNPLGIHRSNENILFIAKKRLSERTTRN
jgi:SAM-dependent methyltransferase